MDDAYTPRADIGRLLLGTPSIIALTGAQCGIEVTAEAGIEAIRAKSIELGRFGLECCDALGLRTSAPRDDAPARRPHLRARAGRRDARPTRCSTSARCSPTSASPT